MQIVQHPAGPSSNYITIPITQCGVPDTNTAMMLWGKLIVTSIYLSSAVAMGKFEMGLAFLVYTNLNGFLSLWYK